MMFWFRTNTKVLQYVLLVLTIGPLDPDPPPSSGSGTHLFCNQVGRVVGNAG